LGISRSVLLSGWVLTVLVKAASKNTMAAAPAVAGMINAFFICIVFWFTMLRMNSPLLFHKPFCKKFEEGEKAGLKSAFAL